VLVSLDSLNVTGRTTAGLRRRVRFAFATNTRFERAICAVGPFRDGAAARASRYVATGGLEPALQLATGLAEAGFAVHVDRFGEDLANATEARSVGDAYVDLAARLHDVPAGVQLALDPSNLGLDISPALLGTHLDRIAAALPADRTITVGAENSARTDAALGEVLARPHAGCPCT